MAEIAEVASLPMNKREFFAVALTANLGMAMLTESVSVEVLRLIGKHVEEQLNDMEFTHEEWNALIDRMSKLGDAAFKLKALKI